jgi:hypothetical protein
LDGGDAGPIPVVAVLKMTVYPYLFGESNIISAFRVVHFVLVVDSYIRTWDVITHVVRERFRS